MSPVDDISDSLSSLSLNIVPKNNLNLSDNFKMSPATPAESSTINLFKSKLDHF